jgi:hypothetical protein
VDTILVRSPASSRAGDRIVAIGGRPLPVAREVAAVEAGALLLVHPEPNPHGVEWRLYANDMLEGVAVEREGAEPVQQTLISSLKDWRKLPPVSRGYTRIPDLLSSGGAGGYSPRSWIRMVRCDTCGSEIASLGIGYHRQNTGH